MTSKTVVKQNGRGDGANNLIYNITSNGSEDKVYTYAEAINLAG